MLATRGSDGYARIAPDWQGATVAIFAGGPSITQAQVDQCKRFRTIAVNDAYRLAPWADVLYFADARWQGWHKDIPEFQHFPGERITIEQADGVEALLKDPAYYVLRNRSRMPDAPHLSVEPTHLCTGSNSGYQAINLAYLAGAKRILLLGFDCRVIDKKTHWFGDHKIPTPVSWLGTLQPKFSWLQLELTKRNVEVVNCSPGTALHSFPQMNLGDAIAQSVLPDSSRAALST